MTLRLKLMAGLVALTALGLVLVGGASALALRSYLLDRVDQQLRRAEAVGGLPLTGYLARAEAEGQIGDGGGFDRVVAPTDYLIEIRRQDGTVARITGGGSTAPSRPLLDTLPAGAQPSARPFTIVAEGDRYRAVTRNAVGGPRVLIALSLRPVVETVGRLVAVELAVGCAVLASIAALAWVWLTRGLRPLRQVISTASAIAGGELGRRVPPGPPRSETGQLAIALNTMLGQIQAAFAERVASQERLRRFAADASHELRTPLTSIRGYADLLRGGMVTEVDARDALRRIQEESGRMSTLVDDLLNLVHLDEQRPAPRRVVDLAEVVRDAVSDLRVAAPARTVTADVVPACPVLGDPDALRQLVGNLVTNARVHTPDGTPIEVRLDGSGVGGAAAILSVTDHGPGLPREVADHVFDRFYRAADTRSRGIRGSGLGLSIVAATAAAHGGWVDVSSTVGSGTVLRFGLPSGPSELSGLSGPGESSGSGGPASTRS